MDNDYQALLQALQRDLAGAEPDFQPTHYWQQCSQRLEQDLADNGLASFRSNPAPLTHFVPTYTFNALAGRPDELGSIRAALAEAMPAVPKMQAALTRFLSGREQAESDYRVYRAAEADAMPHIGGISESAVGRPHGQFEFDGRRFSRSMLNYLLGLSFARRELGSFPVRTVLEIGGGFGTLGEVLLADARNETFYIDVDIPPTSVYATYYLREVLGRERVVDYLAVADAPTLSIDALRDGADAAVLPPWLLPRLEGRIDLFVNFISFQEMEPDVVERYLREVARLRPAHVLLRNLAEGKEIATEDGQLGVLQPTRDADYDRFLPDYELVAADATVYGYSTVDGYHSELRLYRRMR